MVEKRQYQNTDYIIYSDGRCYSNKSNKFLTPQMSVKYPTYNLTINGQKKKKKVHRLVAETFISNPENKPYVNHRDGDTHNFNKDNLEWVTEQENSKHARMLGLSKNNDQCLENYAQDIIPGEIWVPILNYPNYKISSMGRVLNINTNKLKKTPTDNNGYPHVALYKNNQGKTFQVHRLLYQSFYPDEDLTKYTINHKDGDKTNNNLINLEKISYKENNLHAVYEIKTNNCAKSVLMLDENYNIIKEFQSIAEAQRSTGFTNISRAIKKHYKTQGFYWKFKN